MGHFHAGSSLTSLQNQPADVLVLTLYDLLWVLMFSVFKKNFNLENVSGPCQNSNHFQGLPNMVPSKEKQTATKNQMRTSCFQFIQDWIFSWTIRREGSLPVIDDSDAFLGRVLEADFLLSEVVLHALLFKVVKFLGVLMGQKQLWNKGAKSEMKTAKHHARRDYGKDMGNFVL